MRGTLHLVAASDVRWLTGLLGPVFLRLTARRYRELGLDDDDLARVEHVIISALAAAGPLPRAALTARLAAAGLDAGGQVPILMIRRCALLGQLCHGPTLDGQPTFVLLDDWLPPAAGPAPDVGPAVADLASRYLATHAPASAADFTAWSGLPVAPVRAAWRVLADRGELVECEVAGNPSVVPADRAAELADAVGDVRLLPAYDDYMVGWRTRALSVAAPFERQVWPGGGQIRSTVVVDGMVHATWSGATVAAAWSCRRSISSPARCWRVSPPSRLTWPGSTASTGTNPRRRATSRNPRLTDRSSRPTDGAPHRGATPRCADDRGAHHDDTQPRDPDRPHNDRRGQGNYAAAAAWLITRRFEHGPISCPDDTMARVGHPVVRLVAGAGLSAMDDDSASMPADLAEVLTRTLSCEVATIGRDGTPVAWPMLGLYLPDRPHHRVDPVSGRRATQSSSRPLKTMPGYSSARHRLRDRFGTLLLASPLVMPSRTSKAARTREPCRC